MLQALALLFKTLLIFNIASAEDRHVLPEDFLSDEEQRLLSCTHTEGSGRVCKFTEGGNFRGVSCLKDAEIWFVPGASGYTITLYPGKMEHGKKRPSCKYRDFIFDNRSLFNSKMEPSSIGFYCEEGCEIENTRVSGEGSIHVTMVNKEKLAPWLKEYGFSNAKYYTLDGTSEGGVDLNLLFSEPVRLNKTKTQTNQISSTLPAGTIIEFLSRTLLRIRLPSGASFDYSGFSCSEGHFAFGLVGCRTTKPISIEGEVLPVGVPLKLHKNKIIGVKNLPFKVTFKNKTYQAGETIIIDRVLFEKYNQ